MNITNWDQLNSFLKQRNYSEEACYEALTQIDIEESELTDLIVIADGRDYRGTIRSDFSLAIQGVQQLIWDIASEILCDKNHVTLSRSEKDALTFRVSVEHGCTVIKLLTSKPIVKAIARRISSMNRADCLVLGSLFIAGLVVYRFPEMLKEAYPYFETIVLADHQRNEDETSVKEVFNKLSDKCDIQKLKKIMESRDAIDSTIIKNCADVSSIQINSNLYNYESIDQIKHPFNEQTVDTLDGIFQIFQINNKTYPILKIRLKDLKTLEEFTANMDLSSDEESPFDNDQIDLIWETFKLQKQIRLKVIRSFCKGKQRSANIIEILP